MTQSEFRDLIDRMSELNRRDPRAYRAKVRRFLRLGYWAYYGHLGLLLLCFVAMTVVTFVAGGRALVLLVPIAIAVVVVVRATFVVTTVPPGQSVSEDDAPGLFAALRRVCDSLKVRCV